MDTEQGTLVLASLLRVPRRFQSRILGPMAKQRLVAVQKVLDEFDTSLWRADYPRALEKLNAAYGLLEVQPPPATSDDILDQRHPVQVALEHMDQEREMRAWHVWLAGLTTG